MQARTQFGFTLLEAGFAIDAQQHKIQTLSATQRSLTWVRDANASFITKCPSKVSDYLSLLERREYSYLMHDDIANAAAGAICLVAGKRDKLVIPAALLARCERSPRRRHFPALIGPD